MKRLLSLFVLASLLLVVGFASATAVPTNNAKCDGLDLCTWTTSGTPDYGLPLGSEDNSGCGLNYVTYWPVNTEATATCVFDGDYLESAMLYLSVDNDIISCTLGGVEVFEATTHENCAPVDPMDGYSKDISAALFEGENTLVCQVKDRGIMSHFDACVVGEKTTPTVPEFGTIIGIVTALGALGVFFVVRRN